MTPEVFNALNKQIKYEEESSRLYYGLSISMSARGLTGIAAFLEHHAKEETSHKKKFAEYILDRGEIPQLRELDEVDTSVMTCVNLFGKILTHEIFITNALKELRNTAQEVGDTVTTAFVDTFLLEQIEEERWARDWNDRFVLAGEDSAAILLLDRELASKYE